MASRCMSTGRVPMAQPPGSDTLASPQRAEQRPQHPEAGAHLGDEFIGRGGVDDGLGRELLQRFAAMAVLAGALARHHDVDAMVLQDALQLPHVGKPRHIVTASAFRA